jgi:hypothetical protein
MSAPATAGSEQRRRQGKHGEKVTDTHGILSLIQKTIHSGNQEYARSSRRSKWRGSQKISFPRFGRKGVANSTARKDIGNR